MGTSSTSASFILNNTGNVSITLGTATLTGANPGDFHFGGNCGSTLAAGGNCTYGITFLPTASGARSATFNQPITGLTTRTVALSGTGVAVFPIVSLTPTSLDFGSVQDATVSPTKTVQLQNTGTANLVITSILATGPNAADFTLVNHCVSPLVPQGLCTVDGTVTPSIVGTETAAITLTTNASTSPDTVSMTVVGNAIPAPNISISSIQPCLW